MIYLINFNFSKFKFCEFLFFVFKCIKSIEKKIDLNKIQIITLNSVCMPILVSFTDKKYQNYNEI